jgi:hypothetical protein
MKLTCTEGPLTWNRHLGESEIDALEKWDLQFTGREDFPAEKR